VLTAFRETRRKNGARTATADNQKVELHEVSSFNSNAAARPCALKQI
jgi:hypothetical protein